MARTLIIMFATAFCGSLNAQELKTTKPVVAESASVELMLQPDSLAFHPATDIGQGHGVTTPYTDVRRDTIAVMQTSYHYGVGGWAPWYLHKGLNVSVDLSVFAFFGKGSPRGAGVNESISLIHVTPLSDRLTMMLGGYVSNTTFHGNNNVTGGLQAMLDYKLSDHWYVSVYGQKAFNSNKAGVYSTGFYGYPYRGIGYSTGMMSPYLDKQLDKIGAALRYEWNNHSSIQLHIEYNHLPNQRNTYYRQFDYQKD